MKYRFFEATWLSFYSKSLYQDVADNWSGFGLKYLIFIVAISLIPMLVKLHFDIAHHIDEKSPQFIEQIPPFAISEGNVFIDEPQPYTITYLENDQPFIIIDTTGHYQSLEETEAIALLTKTELIVRQQDGVRAYDLSGIETLIVNKQRVRRWLHTFKMWFVVIIYPFALFFSFLFRAIQVFVFAVIGFLLIQEKMAYRSLARLMAVSLTPVIFLSIIINLSSIDVPYWIELLVMIGYLYFAITANLKPSPSNTK